MEAEDTMAASIHRRKIPPISTGEYDIPPLRQASRSQSRPRTGAEPAERQRLIGDGLSDWMTEKVDLSSFVSTSESSPSSSLPPSPLEQDVKVPSDLEVMTSLLQEELAQLEDYFRSESTSAPNKLDKSSKCEKGPAAMGTQSYYQLPYASYGTGQSETSPVVVTLATGELDLASFCGGPVGRTKITRPAPYNYHHRYHHNNGRRLIGEAVKVGEEAGLETWGSRGCYSGSTELSGNHYSTLKTVGKGGHGGVKKVRECALSLKEEENYCFSEGMFCSEEIARGFCLSGSYESHKRDGQLMHNLKVSGSYDSTGMELLHCSKDNGLSGSIPQETMVASEGYYHQSLPGGAEPYHSFIGDLDQNAQVQALEPQHGHYLYPECLADQSYECLSRGEGEGSLLGAPIHRPTQRLKDDHCNAKGPLMGGVVLETGTGERKQKKRDQNKTAAHRYRLRKRAELDCLEEELHGLEGQNRELRDKAESVEREIQYVKDLLIEVYKARSQRLKQDGSA
ncbi:uncharacterized protein atf5b [Genypterus blacodes]|uniref:uncharacterized protein atf5b n=1 Tax=Genypterus blacodes TaxID=154954 RepID=UPI003F7714AC